mgnify:CR=1 FL=1
MIYGKKYQVRWGGCDENGTILYVDLTAKKNMRTTVSDANIAIAIAWSTRARPYREIMAACLAGSGPRRKRRTSTCLAAFTISTSSGSQRWNTGFTTTKYRGYHSSFFLSLYCFVVHVGIDTKVLAQHLDDGGVAECCCPAQVSMNTL